MHLKEPGMLLERIFNRESIVGDELILCVFCVFVCVCSPFCDIGWRNLEVIMADDMYMMCINNTLATSQYHGVQ